MLSTRPVTSYSLGNSISNFRVALSSCRADIVKAIWDANPLLQAWYRGEQVNFGNHLVRDMRQISLSDLIHDFRAALPSCRADIVKAIWDANPLLQAWYRGEPVNFGNHLEKDMRQIPLSHLTHDFTAALPRYGCRINIVKVMWAGNPLLQAWYRGEPVNFVHHDVKERRVISAGVLISDFRSLLSTDYNNIKKAMWDGNPLLQAWYRGEPVNLGHHDVNEMQVISLDELISDFLACLSGRCTDIIKVIWEENPLLRAWYRGEPVNLGHHDVKVMRMISFYDLLSSFKSMLSSRCKQVIMSMWEGNALLRAWYRGEPVNLGHHDVIDMHVISHENLISSFESILSSYCHEVIEAIWDGNKNLHDAIRKSNFDQSKLLLEKVMSSGMRGLNNFIIKFVKCIDDAKLISIILEDTKKNNSDKKLAKHRRNKIRVLQSRLNELKKLQGDDEIAIQESHCEKTVGNSIKITTANKKTTIKKRKTASKKKSKPRKKQKKK